jgi:hypothetical protein
VTVTIATIQGGIVDETNKLRYESKLPDCVEGNFRNPLIRSYQQWKGVDY